MADENETKDAKSCCGKGKCCCGKGLAALALLLLGGLGGYAAARHCGKAPAATSVQAPAK